MPSFTLPTPPPPPAARSGPARPPSLRVGFIPLTDAAPLIAARELGIFARHAVRVELTREVGWATIREKIVYGELDAAHALAPMLWGTQLGIGGMPCEVLTALVLNLHGNALTLAHALRPADVNDAASLQALIRARHREQQLTFGVVSPLSSHHLLLRQWIASAGLHPDRDVRVVTVPPAQMFRNLAAGTVDGYCVGEPWNSLAVQKGAGWCVAWSAALRPGHVEKVLMVTRRLAEKRPDEHAALVAALVEACAWCDEPRNRPTLAEILSGAPYLNLPPRVILPALLGRFDCGLGRVEHVPDFHIFHRGNANVPAAAKAAALQRDLIAAGLLSRPDSGLPHRLFREDLFHAAIRRLPVHEPADSRPVRELVR
ncbi:MAG TPA: CmpA/NrtA family ABC transporter substrate-binding protein [Opitutaceae bacterium]|nr:CmpA/NrtA family ABC transporter substrate-binding protein [Opitutaceae bacterium]